MTAMLHPGERLDDLQAGGYFLIQKPGTFCFGTDAVLLADFAAPRRHENAADLGCGNGAIAILMAARQPEIAVDGIEIQAEMADMASRSVEYNHLEEKIRIHNLDMREAWRTIGREKKSLVVCNPPYGGQGRTLLSQSTPERIARHESDLTPADVARSAAQLLKYGGRFCVVYPAPRAFEMMQAMQACRIAPKRIRSVHASAEKAPKLVLLEGIKGGGSGLKWLPPLVLYDTPGVPSPEYRRIYGMGE